MGKTHKDMYWKHIRLPVAPPSKRMRSEKDYDRKKINIQEILEEDEDV